VRCGRGNMKNASSTELLQVKAGDTIEFAWSSLYPESWIDKYFDCADGRGFCVYSDGSLEPGYVSLAGDSKIQRKANARS